jgi:YidC/Oxa1 family membrane protein insertase
LGIWHGFTQALTWIFVLFTHWSGNDVLGILMLTVLVRLVLLPLGVAQARSMQKMAKVGPRQRELQKRHKGDPQKLNAEMAKLYKEEGVNPAAGCLPLILQLPVMYGLFDVLRSFHYKSNLGWLFWHNLAQPDHTFILPILVAGSTFFMQRQTMQMTPQQPGMESSQKMMLWVMPLIFGFVAYRFPAGLAIYYVISNLFQVVQTTVLLKRPLNGGSPGAEATS